MVAGRLYKLKGRNAIGGSGILDAEDGRQTTESKENVCERRDFSQSKIMKAVEGSRIIDEGDSC